MKIHFQHLRDTPNVGDRSCSPYDYFDWGDATVSDLRKDDTPSYDIGIYGGGQVFGGLSRYAGVMREQSALNIAWGVGTNQTFPISPRHMRSKRKMDIIGSRDYGDNRYTYAPCPSCMSPLFDKVTEPTHEVVFYSHAGKSPKMKLQVPDHIPVKDNLCGSLDEALSFIASGQTVVSNSYHGVYWALLMGRKTICVPFSNKFKGYRLAPHFASPSNWFDELDNGKSYPEMLEMMRGATLSFKSKVDEAIAEKRKSMR
ncbi:polysaccharide pyruvyl transferase family protein [Loktanella sp. S4079]|uniref:polysaccharide pyruvyl transferase family protein n=1 Tax=Loktanella sp. S4079 TaxID=579483 RepID=UPI0005FA5C53|nr:polysaccharide pyruvyl transferase family protein [Loktanella sp. S4079]KJZ19665.1 hypothetical protein TW80_01830 [Loktanella sp. S4079]